MIFGFLCSQFFCVFWFWQRNGASVLSIDEICARVSQQAFPKPRTRVEAGLLPKIDNEEKKRPPQDDECVGAAFAAISEAESRKIIQVRTRDLEPEGGPVGEPDFVYEAPASVHEFASTVCWNFWKFFCDFLFL